MTITADDDRIVAMLPDLAAIRRDIHAHPELGFAEHRTAAIIVAELQRLGLEVTTGIGGTGVVGVLRRPGSNRSVGLRADMDALPFQEETGLPYASQMAGAFHGCGHDGHVAMLLGAARVLARTSDIAGTVNFIFQPAEEGLGGARAMIEDRLFDRFPCDRIFALHNWPDLPQGAVRTRAGPIMASADKFTITIRGKGGHAALPHQTPDALLAAANLVTMLNTVVARRVAATQAAVLSVTQIHGGHTHNVLPAEARVVGTVRTFDPMVQDRVEASIRSMAAGAATTGEVSIDVDYDRYYPSTINDPDAAAAAMRACANVCDDVAEAPEPAFTSEDFAFMLRERPGAYLWLGQRAEGKTAPLHHPSYDFNDAVMDRGIACLVAIACQELRQG